jgi:uncharacterized OB-fold protein
MYQMIDRFNYPKVSQNVVKEFLDSLRKGKFRIPICLKCDLKIWPPANICSNCYSGKIRMSKLESRGRLIEHSFSHIDSIEKLGLVEISGIRIIGILSEGNLNPGSAVKLTKCGLDKDNSPYYEFSAA